MRVIITNLKEAEEQLKEKLAQKYFRVGQAWVKEIAGQIDNMDLIGTGDYKRRWEVKNTEDGFFIQSGVTYAKYLEFGTFSYFKQFGLESFPTTMHPKKKNLSPEERRNFPKGMQPFAPVRRAFVAVKPQVAKILSD